MRTREQDPRVDRLREQLRALGYLDAGVERFVLAGATGGRRPSGIALQASVRIGVLAAILLGPAAAIGLTGRIPGLVTGPRDGFVLALYFGVFFGLAAACTSFVASLAVSWMIHRPGEGQLGRARALAYGAGAFVTLLSLAYLTLWWEAATWTAGEPQGFRVTAVVLAAAAAISLLLGHAVATAASAVIVARTGAELRSWTLARTSWVASAAAVVLAFLGALALFTVTAARETGAPETPSLTVVPSGTRVRMIAIDGFDPDLFEQLRVSGRVPALAAALGGAVARLDNPDASGSDPAADPARAWTTVATAQPASVHGVEGLETRRVAGVQGRVSALGRTTAVRALSAATDLLRLTTPSIASVSERRAKTFWEVAADAGLRTAVVNWWATWPATSTNATILSDRAALRLERGGALDAEIAPASLYEPLRARWPGLRREAAVRAARALDGVRADSEDTSALLRRSAELDATELLLAREVSSISTDLAVVYLPGLDIAQHAILNAEDRDGAAPSAIAARLDALKGYYVALDRLLADALSPAADETVVLVTAPGRVAAAARGRMAVVGKAGRAASMLDASAFDVAPTVLYALGLPISRELAGVPLGGLLKEDFVARYAVRQVPTYGRPSMLPARGSGQPLDQEMIDRLRSLGYVR